MSEDITSLIVRVEGFVQGIGIDIGFAAEILSELHPSFIYVGGLSDPDQMHNLFPRDPWVARV